MRLAILMFTLLFMTPVQAETLTILSNTLEDSHAINARIFSKYVVKYLPATSVLHKEMPGAGGIVLANYMYNVAPRDGWTIATVSKRIPLTGIIGGKNINYDPTKMTWIGSTADGRTDAVPLISNVKEPKVIGFDGVVSANEVMKFLEPVFPEMKVITSYKTSGIKLAFERKEIDAFVNSLIGLKTTKPELLADPDTKVLVQFGNGTTRHTQFKNVPTLSESLKDDRLLKLLRATELSYIIIRGYVAPPGIPEDQAKVLRNAFNKTITDPEYVREANKANFDVSLITHDEINSIIKQMSELPKDILEELR